MGPLDEAKSLQQFSDCSSTKCYSGVVILISVIKMGVCVRRVNKWLIGSHGFSIVSEKKDSMQEITAT